MIIHNFEGFWWHTSKQKILEISTFLPQSLQYRLKLVQIDLISENLQVQ